MPDGIGVSLFIRNAEILESPPVVKVPLQPIRLGNLATPFRTLTIAGSDIRDLSPFEDTLWIELAPAIASIRYDWQRDP